MEPQSYLSSDGDQQPATQRPHGKGRIAALVASTALVAGVGGAGIGYAATRGLEDRSATTSASGEGRSQAVPGSGWSFDDGGRQYDVPVPADPFGQGEDGVNGGRSTDDTATASDAQLTGLVRIVNTAKYSGSKGVGTGMVLTSSGRVVTNHHVVEGSTSLEAKVMSTGRTYAATVVGTDAKDDVAVLQLSGASGLDTVTADTDGASVGDKVTAVGDANGTPDHLSAASGKVTALNDSITTRSEATAAGERLTGLMKISSDVISGDSGGATYDEDGEVVGMTTAASVGGAEIDGYAVPIDKVLSIVDDLENGVTSSRYDYDRPAFLGVGLSETGATVAGVYEGTPAAAAGIAAGDRITAIGSTRVSTSAQVQAAVGRLDPGDQVSVSWIGDGASETRSVTLASGPVE